MKTGKTTPGLEAGKPVLSIGMIFKNEIRCLERCLQSLEPLRRAVPCELVLADTGSDDGSREVAARYADTLFDFQWADDFSAARNAVLSRCSGEWYLAIDADEWLEDVSGIVSFLKHPKKWDRYNGHMLTVRNYTREDLTGDYGDFLVLRMARLASGLCYKGSIHENLSMKEPYRLHVMSETVLHHDGYVGLGRSEAGKAKAERNAAILKTEMEKAPDDLRLCLLYLESFTGEGDEYERQIRRAIEGVERRLPEWELWGPVLYCHAVALAVENHMPEARAWGDRMQKLFPRSPFTRIDAAWYLFRERLEHGDYSEAASLGQKYLRAVEDYHAGRNGLSPEATGVLTMASPSRKDQAHTMLAGVYVHLGEYQKALELLRKLDGKQLDAVTAGNYAVLLMKLHSQGNKDLSRQMAEFWRGVSLPVPDQRAAEQRREEIVRRAEPAFSDQYRTREDVEGVRHAWTVFLPLAGECPLGDSALELQKAEQARAPVLSFGIIFKNEIRCLERCLRSLASVREAVPCEVVMADTGSGDGSREAAARYADILFDFPWVNDFAAARNAVLARCSGKWYFSIDADEWLEDCSELIAFLSNPQKWKGLGNVGVTLRNYGKLDSKEDYAEAIASRLIRRTPDMRYTGAIHELPENVAGGYGALRNTILHHDGYANFDGEDVRAKRARNMKLLEKELALHPDNLQRMIQCFESAGENKKDKYLHMMLDGVKARLPDWKNWGASIYVYAVKRAYEQDLPELEEWAEEGRKLFPRFPCVMIDLPYFLLAARRKREDPTGAARAGEEYLSGLEDYRAGRYDSLGMFYSHLVTGAPAWEALVRSFTAEALAQLEQYDRAKQMLAGVDPASLTAWAAKPYMDALFFLESRRVPGTESILTAAWKKLSGLPEEDANRRKRDLQGAGVAAFFPDYRAREAEKGLSPAWRVFLPIAGTSPLGDAAAILDSEDPDELTARLAAVKNWRDMPASALAHGLERGAVFPTRAESSENLDELAAFLVKFSPELADAPAPDTRPGICWAQALALAALRTCKWDEPETGMALAKKFVQAERRYLPLCYAADALTEEGLFLLPPAHRFGWYCIQAFDAFERGDKIMYIRLLKRGLEEWPESREMVEFLADHFPPSSVSPELLALAEKVRAILAGYPADDPAILELKKSPVYQRVAPLIERDLQEQGAF